MGPAAAVRSSARRQLLLQSVTEEQHHGRSSFSDHTVCCAAGQLLLQPPGARCLGRHSATPATQTAFLATIAQERNKVGAARPERMISLPSSVPTTHYTFELLLLAPPPPSKRLRLQAREALPPRVRRNACERAGVQRLRRAGVESQRAVVRPHVAHESKHLRRRNLDRALEHSPGHLLSARRRGEGTRVVVVVPVMAIRWEGQHFFC